MRYLYKINFEALATNSITFLGAFDVNTRKQSQII